MLAVDFPLPSYLATTTVGDECRSKERRPERRLCLARIGNGTKIRSPSLLAAVVTVAVGCLGGSRNGIAWHGST